MVSPKSFNRFRMMDKEKATDKKEKVTDKKEKSTEKVDKKELF